MTNTFDVIVAGGGHAGAEAALAASRLGARTLLLSMNLDHIAQMSCNPAIGGIAKGQLVREIDALGGSMGKITEAAMIQFRMLNRRKGPAVWSPRAQCDKVCYQRAMKFELEQQPSLTLRQGSIASFHISCGKIVGIGTELGENFKCAAVVITPGTFMSGKLHYGLVNCAGGRAGDPPSNALPISLKEQLGLELGRLKTGTPPRVLAKSVHFEKMTRQESEISDEYFSFFPEERAFPRTTMRAMPCYLTRSTHETADIVRKNLDRSPLYAGEISGVGTRYCPSFEDKIVRFPHHETHQIYLEPEGEFTGEYYLNGISTSLPIDVQDKMIRSLPGLEDVQISRYAYAIEYDFVFPHQIHRTLSVKKWDGLFLAGQINGTSGYEEAAGQGLLAGLNAARHAGNLQAVEFGRDSSYLAVMVDDLVTKDIIEPYRLFTSRAEYRLSLRQDNANLRLCPEAEKLGLLTPAKFAEFKLFRDSLARALETLSSATVHDGLSIHDHMRNFGGHIPSHMPFPPEILGLDLKIRNDRLVLKELATTIHYEGYLGREEKAIARLRKLEEWRIPDDFDYKTIEGLKNESRIKLLKVRPSTLAQASRIDGLTPPELSLLQVYLTRRSHSTG